jgi:hypothetical protein
MFDMPKTGTWEVRGGWVVTQLMADFGLTAEQAAGLVGNLGFESAGFTKLQEIAPIAGRGGLGWPQWTSSRRVAFESWCRARALATSSDEANYGYLVEELKGAYKNTIAQLKNTDSLEAAVWSVGQTYERPGGTTDDNLPGFADRLHWAQRALAGSDNGLRPAPSPAPAPESSDYNPLLDDFLMTARTLQCQLKALGLYTGAVDGQIGHGTSDAAMKAFRMVPT